MAYYTSVGPMMDRYPEINPEDFYRATVVGESNCGLLTDYVEKYKDRVLFADPRLRTAEINEEDCKLKEKDEGNDVVGWYYPWSINFFDEEIAKIYNSDGLIGIMADERTLGWYNNKYKDADYIEARSGFDQQKLFQARGL